MEKTLVINDLHVGVQRTGGTTLASAAALREYAQQRHATLLDLAPEHDCKQVIVNGDLADAYDIPLIEALGLYGTTDDFMHANPDIDVVWALGNHDLSKNSKNLGSVAFIGALLGMKYKRFRLVNNPQPIGDDGYLIPHVPNQDLFDLAIINVPDNVKWLFLHCNLDNRFACDADHSLDLSRAQAKALKARGIRVVLGHEHQGREILGGHIIVVGNQFPTSVADCLSHGDGQKDGCKRAMIIDGDSLQFIPTWTPDDVDGWYATIDWRELSGTQEEGRGFIRVEGTALAAEAANVIKAISTFRQRSQSYVVANAVKVEQIEGLGDVAASIEDIRSVNVLEMLKEMLDPRQRAAIEKLYEEV